MTTDPKELAQTLIQENFPKFGEIRVPVDYSSVASSTYDPSTGTVVEIVNSTQSAVYMIFTSYEEKAVDGQAVLINDMKALCPTLDLNVVPSDLDYLLRSDVRWNVQNVRTDPANAMWTLHIRKAVT